MEQLDEQHARSATWSPLVVCTVDEKRDLYATRSQNTIIAISPIDLTSRRWRTGRFVATPARAGTWSALLISLRLLHPSMMMVAQPCHLPVRRSLQPATHLECCCDLSSSWGSHRRSTGDEQLIKQHDDGV